jgi:hypothetical protein
MSKKTIPSDERVQILTPELMQRDAATIRALEGGPDVRLFNSETDEGPGIPLRADDEIPVREEEGWGSAREADGLWAETETSANTELIILKGTAIRRNVRREVNASVANIVETNNYTELTGFDNDGSAYPYTFDPGWIIQEIGVTQSANVDMVVTTIDGDQETIPLASRSATLDHLAVDKVEFQDPNNTGAAIGGWLAGGATQ